MQPSFSDRRSLNKNFRRALLAVMAGALVIDSVGCSPSSLAPSQVAEQLPEVEPSSPVKQPQEITAGQLASPNNVLASSRTPPSNTSANSRSNSEVNTQATVEATVEATATVTVKPLPKPTLATLATLASGSNWNAEQKQFLNELADWPPTVDVQVPTGDQSALKEAILKCAADGDRQAVYVVGSMYAQGMLFEKDANKALSYLKTGVDTGDMPSKFGYGAILIQSGNPEDVQRGVALIQAAAKADVVEALSLMGTFQTLGWVLPKDETAAAKALFRMLTIAPKHEGTFAMWQIALSKAELTPEESAAMLTLMQKHVDAGSVRAMCCMANCYREGKSFEKNLSKAKQYYEMAMDKHCAEAFSGMGMVLLNEIESDAGGQFDFEKSRARRERMVSLFQRAVDLGDPTAATMVKLLRPSDLERQLESRMDRYSPENMMYNASQDVLRDARYRDYGR